MAGDDEYVDMSISDRQYEAGIASRRSQYQTRNLASHVHICAFDKKVKGYLSLLQVLQHAPWEVLRDNDNSPPKLGFPSTHSWNVTSENASSTLTCVTLLGNITKTFGQQFAATSVKQDGQKKQYRTISIEKLSSLIGLLDKIECRTEEDFNNLIQNVSSVVRMSNGEEKQAKADQLIREFKVQTPFSGEESAIYLLPENVRKLVEDYRLQVPQRAGGLKIE